MKLQGLGLMLTAFFAFHAQAAAPLRLVHIDHVDPQKVKEFEEIRRTWLAVVQKKNLDTLNKPLQQWGDSTFVTFDPIQKLADLDDDPKAPAPPPDDAPTKAARAAYHAKTHDTLIPPHHSEVWSFDDELSFLPKDSTVTEENFGVAELVTLHVPVAQWEIYKHTMLEINKALTTAHYPLPTLFFETTFGSGRCSLLRLARDNEQLKKAGSVEEVLVKTLGEKRAQELIKARDSISVQREMMPVVVRRDLIRTRK